jgi:hypothetical protein
VSGEEWVLAGPATALAQLEPLIEVHRRYRKVRLLRGLEGIGACLKGAAAVLIVAARSTSPRRAFSGIFLQSPDGRQVPVGWLPAARQRLPAYAAAAAAVQERRHGLGPIVVLAELDPRALTLADRIIATLPGDIASFNWSSQRISRLNLIDALGCGPGVALYVGHGFAGGWAGYGGFGCDAIAEVAGEPMGALLSICCSAASRPRGGASFCEEAVLSGACGAALGASGPTLHAGNAALSLVLAELIAERRVTNLADLLLAAAERTPVLHRYRIFGDPLTPLAGAVRCEAAARGVLAPGPDDELPVIPLSAWMGA